MPLRWSLAAVGCEGSPLLFADRDTYRRWRGTDPHDGSSDYRRVVLDGGLAEPIELVTFEGSALGLMDSDGDRAFDIGCDKREVVVLAYFDTGSPKHAARIRAAVARRAYPEYLVGELVIAEGGLAIANSVESAASAPQKAFFVELPPGRYTVLEGRDEDDDATPWWARIRPATKKLVPRRPAEPARDPVADIMARVSFEDPKQEARALEAALELVELGRADLALDLCQRASPARRYLASYTRVFALAATDPPEAVVEATALAEAWLAPATTPDAASQTVTRAQVLRALAAARVGESLRERVATAPEPEIVMGDGETF